MGQYNMSKKTYTLDELSDLLGFHKAKVKVVLRKLFIDPDELIEEEDAELAAQKFRRPWPPEEK